MTKALTLLGWLAPLVLAGAGRAQVGGAEPGAAQEGERGLLDQIRTVWEYHIVEVDGKWITPGGITLALAMLLVGFVAARLLSQFVRSRLLSRFKLSEGGAAAIQSLTFYVLLIVVGLSAVKVAGLPLTALTVLGGALAIGVGFGSQNIINNFISGLILLAERPIRVGDLIQVGDLYGNVSHIGARSTRVTTGSNIEILVPNSAFLEQNVVNWTLSESTVRISASVGVAYGSPVREVERLLNLVAEQHERVLPNPTPIVLFTEFGDNSLGFEVHFWMRTRSLMDQRRVQSDLHFAIDEAFAKAEITIAFPQRDVHLDVSAPIPVRVVTAAEGGA